MKSIQKQVREVLRSHGETFLMTFTDSTNTNPDKDWWRIKVLCQPMSTREEHEQVLAELNKIKGVVDAGFAYSNYGGYFVRTHKKPSTITRGKK